MNGISHPWQVGLQLAQCLIAAFECAVRHVALTRLRRCNPQAQHNPGLVALYFRECDHAMKGFRVIGYGAVRVRDPLMFHYLVKPHPVWIIRSIWTVHGVDPFTALAEVKGLEGIGETI